MWFDKQFERWGLNTNQWYMAHREIAKIRLSSIQNTHPLSAKLKAKIVLVTAMNPTPSGEGKTTTAISLTDALNTLGFETIATLRQPSVGPVFGKKGGATGGGKASIVPHDQIDLGLSGDFYAVENANNTIAALIDNHIYHKLFPAFEEEVFWKRCLDVNDRSLRSINISSRTERSFVITAASELMAILSLSRDFLDLKTRIGACVLGMERSTNRFLTAQELGFHKVAAVILRDAFFPNLVRTLEDSPVIMHAGPFANIAQGTNSIAATTLAASLSEYVVTEAGFGAELGAEKFFNIKARLAKLSIACSVVVATIKAIKHHGIQNLLTHVSNLKKFGPPVVVCLNRFSDDSDHELKTLISQLREKDIVCEISDGYEKGSDGSLDLAKIVVETSTPTQVKFSYSLNCPIEKKVENIAKDIYRVDDVLWTTEARARLKQFKEYRNLPICIAKNPLSLNGARNTEASKSKNQLVVRDLKLQAGAGFIVPITGSTMLLPGFPKKPRALDVDLSDDGEILW